MTHVFLSAAGVKSEECKNVINGLRAQDELEDALFAEWQSGSVSSYVRNYRIGIKGYENASQFYAAFMIQFENRERWIVYSTTSCRSDRLKEQQWDADNIRRLDDSVSKAYLVFPDWALDKEIRAFRAMSSRYESRKDYSRLDAIVSATDLVSLVRSHAEEIRCSPKRGVEFAPPAAAPIAPTEVGRLLDFNGRKFENDVAVMLSDAWNLKKWNAGGSSVSGGVNYEAFERLMTVLGFVPGTVAAVRTHLGKEIGKLPSKGTPKTDVLAVMTMADGGEERRTISCKRPNDPNRSKAISCHQYKADAFADVLDSSDSRLRELLNVAQSVGCAVEHMKAEDVTELAERLAPHVRKLAEWAVEGTWGEGTQDQIAKYIVTYLEDGNCFSACTTAEYVEALLKRPVRKRKGLVSGFGTPFSWTYQGDRGTNIQLKMPILH